MVASRIVLGGLLSAMLAACATYPMHPESVPLGPPRAGAPMQAESVRLVVAPLPRTERCGSHYYYRLALRPLDLPGQVTIAREDEPPRRARKLGDVRSADVALTSEQADALERAWWRATDWPPAPASIDCSRHLMGYARNLEERVSDDGAQTQALLEHALDDLRARAAEGGAEEIDDVRCYIVANTLSVTPRRLWCEGIATSGAGD